MAAGSLHFLACMFPTSGGRFYDNKEIRIRVPPPPKGKNPHPPNPPPGGLLYKSDRSDHSTFLGVKIWAGGGGGDPKDKYRHGMGFVDFCCQFLP